MIRGKDYILRVNKTELRSFYFLATLSDRLRIGETFFNKVLYSPDFEMTWGFWSDDEGDWLDVGHILSLDATLDELTLFELEYGIDTKIMQEFIDYANRRE